MPTLTLTNSEAHKLALLRALLKAIVEVVSEAGPEGAPGGLLYTMMAHGIDFESYTAVMETLVRQRRLVRRNHCYHVVVPQGTGDDSRPVSL